MNNELGLPSEVPERNFEHNPSNWTPIRGVPGGTSGKYIPDGIERFIPKPEPAFFHEISDHRGLQRTFKLVKIFKIYGNS